ncbi:MULTISPECIES: endonuclease/exonuclease/phosphatase family protein [Bifidobacterium]|uniref:endonuclease/exonuclease/phosphatase family protein n=1 Tax=Bifidobacterium TaxID=1678 RepID=UPI0013D5E641|nr:MULTISPECIES: endonuclease/exonuclease/phosphatase family protein [Bifidobacterium]
MILWILLAVIALWMTLKYLPASADRHRPLPEVIALIPLLIVPIVLLLALAAVLRLWPQCVMAIVLLVVQLLWQAAYIMPMPAAVTTMLGIPRQSVATTTATTTVTTSTTSASATTVDDGADAASTTSPSMPSGSQSSTPSQASRTIRVMTLNTRYGRADTGTIMHLVKQERIDLLAVQEVNDDLIHRLEVSHIDDELPYRVLGKSRPDDNAGSNALFMRFEPMDFSDESVNISAAAAPVARVRLGSQIVEFASVHPKSPPRSGQDWSDGVRALGRFAIRADKCNAAGAASGTTNNVKLPTDANGIPKQYSTAAHCAAVVLGDLNSSVYHPSFRDALRQGSGLADSSLELHRGWNNTFPASWPTFPALIEIDHVLHTSGIVAKSAHSAKIPRTDHRALIVELEIE